MDYFEQAAVHERRYELLEELRVLDLQLALDAAQQRLSETLELQSESYDDEEFQAHQVDVEDQVQVVHDLEVEVAEALQAQE